MGLLDTLRGLGRDIVNVVLNRDDVRQAARDVRIEGANSSEKDVREVVGTGNLLIANHVGKVEGVNVAPVLNDGTVKATDELGGALGTYEVKEYGGSGRISLFKRFLYNPLHALGIYVHEAGHKVLEALGYERVIKERVNYLWRKNPMYAMYTAIFGRDLNEGLVDLYFRLGLVGENGMRSAYQREGFVDAAAYALKRSGGKIRKLVERLPRAIDDFVEALYFNPRSASQAT